MKWLSIVRYSIFITLIVLALSRLIPQLGDFKEVLQLKNQVNYWYVLAAILTQFVQYMGDAWLSQVLLSIVKTKMTIANAFRIAALNVFAAHMLPVGEAGGMAAAYHFYRKLGVTTDKFIFLSICWGFLTHFVLLSLFFISFLLIPDIPIDIHLSFAMIVVLVFILVGCVILFTKKSTVKLFVKRYLGKYDWAREAAAFIRNWKTYRNLMINKPGHVFLAVLATTMYYAANVATLGFSFLAFGQMPSVPLLTFAFTASLIIGRLTLAPAGVGTAEATLILIFLQAGVEAHVAVAATLVFRLISFWLPIPFGAASYISLKNIKPLFPPPSELEKGAK